MKMMAALERSTCLWHMCRILVVSIVRSCFICILHTYFVSGWSEYVLESESQAGVSWPLYIVG